MALDKCFIELSMNSDTNLCNSINIRFNFLCSQVFYNFKITCNTKFY